MYHDDRDSAASNAPLAREVCIEKMVSCCLELDETWVRDVYMAGHLAALSDRPHGNTTNVGVYRYIAQAVAQGMPRDRNAHTLEPEAKEAHQQAVVDYCGYIDEMLKQDDVDLKSYCDMEGPQSEAYFEQVAVQTTIYFAMACIMGDVTPQSRSSSCDATDAVRWSARFVDDNVLRKVQEQLEQLQHDCKAWKRQQLLPLCGAIVCGLGMALPMLWGAVLPWTFVLLGASFGGLLMCQDVQRSQLSVGQVAGMLMGWTVIGLGAGVVAWGVLSLVAGHGAALAAGAAAIALCWVGLRSLGKAAGRMVTITVDSGEKATKKTMSPH